MFDNRISLYLLEVFRLVVELGGVTPAANQLFISQPVVSTHIRSLEQRLGVPLFNRDRRSLQLTEAGQAVHQWATEILIRSHEIEREIGEIADGRRGAIAIMASMSVGSYVLPAVLAKVAKDRPDAEITIQVADSSLAMDAAEIGHADFAVVIAEGVDENRDLVGEMIGEEELVLLAAPDGVPHGNSITRDTLATLPFVCSPDGFERRRLLDRQLAAIGLRKRRVVLELGHPEAMKRATRSGLGVSILFRSAVTEDLAAGKLREVRIEGAELSVPVFIVRRTGKRLSRLQQHVYDEIVEHYKVPLGDAVAGQSDIS